MNTTAKPILHRQCIHCARIDPVASADCNPACDRCIELRETLLGEATEIVRREFDNAAFNQVMVVRWLTELYHKNEREFRNHFGESGLGALRAAIAPMKP